MLSRRVWFRATVFTALAIVFALAAGVLGAVLPFRVTIELGQNSVGSLLQIIATAMLTATTFSVTAMVSAYSAATTNATPRATQLLIADPTSQNALSTFVGSFTFAMVGIIALSTGYYTEQGRTILFFGTLVVIAVIVVTLLRWIAHLADFGRMPDVVDRVEEAATAALVAHAASPALGASVASGPHEHWSPVWAERSGYVSHVDMDALQQAAEGAAVTLLVVTQAGRLTDRSRPLARVSGDIDDETRRAIVAAFRVGARRSFEQDPRFGVIALAEIGSRALSPSTNDPGTAIEVIAALQRVFERALTTAPDRSVAHPSLAVVPPTLEELLVDAFRPIARDGAGFVEVHVRLQKSLAALAACAPERARQIETVARALAKRADEHLDEADRAELAREGRGAWAGVA
ncbi:Uncharacterized membrane protein [Agrococcus carbonis]|uniref:Uncharacterized membrane protein n=2 Tax=Agrococcus carbonis TaxID=684552 RepID=A0A1H1T1W5_9MICO|nr:Uncharacterized membrane protein [Agrococcus carbonis]